mmetsp:Transcript_29773/g.76886  ORF Transcript_29773/g.76886 Transcript_29773/m.76886 type:complete len:201 (-) Transcript_29773:253-855(-)
MKSLALPSGSVSLTGVTEPKEVTRSALSHTITDPLLTPFLPSFRKGAASTRPLEEMAITPLPMFPYEAPSGSFKVIGVTELSGTDTFALSHTSTEPVATFPVVIVCPAATVSKSADTEARPSTAFPSTFKATGSVLEKTTASDLWETLQNSPSHPLEQTQEPLPCSPSRHSAFSMQVPHGLQVEPKWLGAHSSHTAPPQP